MRISEKAIVLQSIKHGDSKLILKLYTRGHGLVTAAAITGKSARSKVRASSLLSLSMVDAELILKQNKEVQQLVEASVYRSNAGLSESLNKLSIAQFMNEILVKVIKEHVANPHLYEFIETCLSYLNDSEQDFLNLHLYFMTELTRYLGFEPQNNFERTAHFFDMREGRFSAAPLAFPLGLNESESQLFSDYLRGYAPAMKLEAAHRQMLLDIILAYYRLHVPGFNEVRSLQVLRAVLS
jgi:DNA repair protein RecO (recombination protein O)